MGIIGVYFKQDPGGMDDAKKGVFRLPFGAISIKGLSVGTGQAFVKHYNAYPRDLIIVDGGKQSSIATKRLPMKTHRKRRGSPGNAARSSARSMASGASPQQPSTAMHTCASASTLL